MAEACVYLIPEPEPAHAFILQSLQQHYACLCFSASLITILAMTSAES